MTDGEGAAQDMADFQGLWSSSPTVRLRTARSLMGDVDDRLRQTILERIQHEPVPQIRTALEMALNEKVPRAGTVAVGDEDHSSGEDLEKLIVHEISPAIGRVELEMLSVMPDYEDSAVAEAVDKLRRRVTAVAKVAGAHRSELQLGRVNLIEVVQGSRPSDSNILIEVEPESADETFFEIESDVDVLSMLFEAALNNAVEAQEISTFEHEPIVVEIVATEISCVVTITNRFPGGSIAHDQVLAMGRTTKFGGRGTGMRVIDGAARRLKATWNFNGTAGVATLSIRIEK